MGEIYDQADPDVKAVERLADGSILVNGNFPIHDLDDIDVYHPEGDYTTVAGPFSIGWDAVLAAPGTELRSRVGFWSQSR